MKGSIHIAAFILWFIPFTAYSSFLSDEELSMILAGNIIVKESNNENGVPGLIAAFSVSSTRENIWNALIDYENFTKIFRGVNRLKVIRKDNNGALVEFWVDAVLSDLNYTLYRKYDIPNFKLSWSRESGDLKVIEGSWEIVDLSTDANKIIVYSSYVEVGRLIPTKLVRWGAMRKAEEMCINLREWIE